MLVYRFAIGEIVIRRVDRRTAGEKTMTEEEWLSATDSEPMLEFLHDKVSERKWRLYFCAGCRSIAHLLYRPASIRAVEVGECFVDGDATEEELREAAYWAE